MTNETAPPRIHVLAQPTGATWQPELLLMAFFLNKGTVLYPGSHFRMSDRVLENYIRPPHRVSHRADKVTGGLAGWRTNLEWASTFYRRRHSNSRTNTSGPGMSF